MSPAVCFYLQFDPAWTSQFFDKKDTLFWRKLGEVFVWHLSCSNHKRKCENFKYIYMKQPFLTKYQTIISAINKISSHSSVRFINTKLTPRGNKIWAELAFLVLVVTCLKWFLLKVQVYGSASIYSHHRCPADHQAYYNSTVI